MPTVNFYLKKAEGSPARSLIYLQFKYSGKRLVYSFGQNIEPGNWSKAKKRVKNNKQTTDDGQHSLNDLLDNLEKVCIKAYNEDLADGIPPPSTIKAQLDAFVNKNKGKDQDPKIFQLFDRFISGEIKHKGKDKTNSTLKGYKTVKGHLQAFASKKKYPVAFDHINLDFFYQYTSFLKSDLGLRPNTIGKDVTILKTIMGEAVDLGYTSNMQFKHKKFTYEGEETDAVYLTEQEVINLFRQDFTGNKRLEQVRDLFVFGCFVGLRFSDYSAIQPGNIVPIDGDMFIKTITKKTKEQVIIPCNPVILEIFEKYKDNHNRLPKAPSNQKFNDYIKEVCRYAKLTEIGRLTSHPTLELCECISSHTARRSMATNYYLQGFPTIDLMKITGHKTEKAFLTYIRVTKLDAAKRMNEHIKKNWGMKILKIAS
ncbi:MAG TPA: site-specific integrase [Puia sp.]|jgi:integrase